MLTPPRDSNLRDPKMGGNGLRKGGRSKKKGNKNKKNARPKLRFKFGQRVECTIDGGWAVGTVVRLWYDTEISGGTSTRPWEDGVFRPGVPGFIAPYQMLMDSGDLLFAPYDDDGYIRESDVAPMPIEHNRFLRVEVKRCKNEEWRLGVVIAATENWVEKRYSPYYIKFDDGTFHNFYGPASFIRRAQLRFKIGDRVQNRVCDGSGSFVTGTVLKVWPSSDYLEEGGVVPYSVRLDDGREQEVPFDSDDWIKASDSLQIEVKFRRGQQVEYQESSGGEWRSGIILQSNPDWLERDCAPYFIKFDDGKSELCWAPSIIASHTVISAEENLCMNDDDSLFSSPPPMPDCPICYLPLPIDDCGYINKECCGVTICDGCKYSHSQVTGYDKTCPFCRSLPPTKEEVLDRMWNRIERCDAENTFCMGVFYGDGMPMYGIPKNERKAFELFLRAADLGSPRACTNTAIAYLEGIGIEKDETKAMYYFEKGAKLGQVKSRHSLGSLAAARDYWDTAFRHWKISASAGYKPSLDQLNDNCIQGMFSKEEYEDVLHAYEQSSADASSEQREVARQEQILRDSRFIGVE